MQVTERAQSCKTQTATLLRAEWRSQDSLTIISPVFRGGEAAHLVRRHAGLDGGRRVGIGRNG
jgi:hypothetical protein